MQTRTRNALVLGAVLALASAGFVAMTRSPGGAPAARGALDAVPEGALLVATADASALRSASVAAPLFADNREIPGLGKVRDVCGFDPMAGLEELAVAVPASGGDGDFGLLGAGSIDDEALLGCARKVIEARGGRPVVNAIGSFRAVRDADAQSGAEIAVRKGGPVLLGAGPYLRSMIDASDGRLPSVRKSEAHERLGREVGGGAIRVTVVLSAEQRRTLAEELSQSGAPGSPAGSIAALGLSVGLGTTVSLHGVMACDNAKACGDLAGVLDARRAAQADDRLMRLLGFAPALERLKITAEGDRLHARVLIPIEEASVIVDRLMLLRPRAPEAVPSAQERPRIAPDDVIHAGDRDAGRDAPAREDDPHERPRK